MAQKNTKKTKIDYDEIFEKEFGDEFGDEYEDEEYYEDEYDDEDEYEDDEYDEEDEYEEVRKPKKSNSTNKKKSAAGKKGKSKSSSKGKNSKNSKNSKKSKKKGKNSNMGHYIFFGIVAVVIIGVVISVIIWNKGTDEDSNIVIDEAEFDTEPNDYILPLTTEQLSGKPDDGVTTILALGNSGFADDGDNNLLAKAFEETMNAKVINASFADSLMSRSLEEDVSIMNQGDGISLYYVTEALCTGDNSKVVEDAGKFGEEALARAQSLSSIDMNYVDCVVIFYDISDYIEKRLNYSPMGEDDSRAVSGALCASANMIKEKYPFIRIVAMSPPASGMTIDDYYIDATSVDLGSGTMNDYIGRELGVSAGCGISYIDLMYGAITVDNRDKYIVDDYHLNEAGAKAIAERFKKLIVLN